MNVAIETRMHSGLVLKTTEAALTTLEKGGYQYMYPAVVTSRKAFSLSVTISDWPVFCL